MIDGAAKWWSGLRIQHKVWAVLLLLCGPLIGGLFTHLYLAQKVLALQEQRNDLVLAHEQINLLRRLAIDIEDGFRGYVLTQQPDFLTPLTLAESKIDDALIHAKQALAAGSGLAANFEPIERRLKDLLRSKRELIRDIQRGNAEKALAYVRSGEELQLSVTLRQELRAIEDRLKQQRESFNARATALSNLMLVGLWIGLCAVVFLGWASSRMLAHSLTDPITRLHSATQKIGSEVHVTEIAELLSSSRDQKDELGRLKDAYLDMARRIQAHIREIEVIATIGHEINTIGPDGLDGVVRRITDRAVELIQADCCLILLREERMGCWVVEAASGEWNERLKKSVMLWEEFPICVQAFETRMAATGDRFHSDKRPQVIRRNLIGDSMLAIPLLSQGAPFGVLSLLSRAPRSPGEWNQDLANGLAHEAALALSNARLFDAAQQKQRGLLARLRQLEHLAETLAHDLKGPGARMEELAKLLSQKFSGQLDERTARWLMLIQENGNELVRRVEGILEVAHVGARQGAVTAVDPRIVLDDVLKAQAGEIERLGAIVRVDPGFPLVACHGAYLRQVFDNLFSNALKYGRPGESPSLTVSSYTELNMVCFSVRDRGTGIPVDQRSRVFEPFVRLAHPETKGSGIGLTIVQRIVELYGGRVWLEGSENEGCTVKFTVPCLMETGSVVDPSYSETALPIAMDASTKETV